MDAPRSISPKPDQPISNTEPSSPRSAQMRRASTILSQSSGATTFSISIQTKAHYTCAHCNSSISGLQILRFSRRNSFRHPIKCTKCDHVVVQFGATPPTSRRPTFSTPPLVGRVWDSIAATASNSSDRSCSDPLPIRHPGPLGSLAAPDKALASSNQEQAPVEKRDFAQNISSDPRKDGEASNVGMCQDGLQVRSDTSVGIINRTPLLRRGIRSMLHDLRMRWCKRRYQLGNNNTVSAAPSEHVCSCTKDCPCVCFRRTSLPLTPHQSHQDSDDKEPGSSEDNQEQTFSPRSSVQSPQRDSRSSWNPSQIWFERRSRFRRPSSDRNSSPGYPSILSFGHRSPSRGPGLLLAPQLPHAAATGPVVALHNPVLMVNQAGSLHDSGMGTAGASARSESVDSI